MDASLHAAHGRRQRRALTAPMAVGYQLLHLMEELGLRAIVVADDLGRPLVQAGDRAITSILADTAMWSAYATHGVDALMVRRLRTWYPDILPTHVAAMPLGIAGATVLAVGTHATSRDAVDRAREGIARICRATAGIGPQLFDDAPAAKRAPTSPPAPWREDGVLWLVRR